MRVSIITPSYNRAVLLPETIDSILGQEYPDLEYLVLDDGSTDDTQDVLARYAGRIRVIHHENMGETATVNKGFSLVTGEIVCVVSSDDPLLPGAISHVVAGFGQNPEAVAVYPDWVDIGEHGQFLRAVRLPDYDVKNMLTSLSWGIGPGAFFRRQLIAQIGGRNSSRVYCGDMEFWAIAAMQGRLVHLPRLLATHRTHQDSASVGQLGGNFANEWVETWKDLLRRPELPKDVRVLAPALMEKVRVSASKNYVGNDKGVAGLLLAQGKYLLPAINQLRRAPKNALLFLRDAYTGILRDEPTVEVVIRHDLTKAVAKGRTDGVGIFSAPDLPAGMYQVKFSSGEMQSWSHSGGQFSVRTTATRFRRIRRSLRAPLAAVTHRWSAISTLVRRAKHDLLIKSMPAPAPVPAVALVIERAGAGIVASGLTDSVGRFIANDLPPDSYTIRFVSGELQSQTHGGGALAIQMSVPQPGVAALWAGRIRAIVAFALTAAKRLAQLLLRPVKRALHKALADPPPGIGVRVETLPKGRVRTARTDANGVLRMERLPAGSYRLNFANANVQHVVHAGGAFTGQTSFDPSSVVERGLASRMRLLLGPPIGRAWRLVKRGPHAILDALFSVPPPGIDVALESAETGRTLTGRTDVRGSLTFRKLAKGTYTVKFSNGEMQTHAHPGGVLTVRTAAPPIVTIQPAGSGPKKQSLARRVSRHLLLIGGDIVLWRYRLHPGVTPGVPNYSFRIAICTRFTPPLWSGQAVMLGRLFEGLSPDRYCMVSLPLYPEKADDVDFTPALPGKRYLLPAERELPRLPVPLAWQDRWRQLRLLYQVWQRGINIARTLQSDSADTIVGCSGDLLDLPAAWLAARLLKIRFAVYFFDDYTEQWWADPPLRRFAMRVERWIIARADKIIVTNEMMQQEIRHRYARMSEIVRNPAAHGEIPALMESYPAQAHEVRLVFTGAVYHLNYDILRAIISGLATIQEIKHRLHIYTAQDRAQLEAEGLVGPHVEIHSHVTPQEATEIQRAADILVIPFSFVPEAKGIIRTAGTAKLADYLAAGRPILAVCQEDSFVTWFLRSRECGIAVPSADPALIASAVRSILEQPQQRLQMQRNARREGTQEFDPVIAQGALVKALGMMKLPAYLNIAPPPARPGQLRIVQVSSVDLVGLQVNGFLTHKWLQEQGHDSRMLVNTRMSGDPCVKAIGSPFLRALNPIAQLAESKLDSTAMLPLLSHHLDNDPWVREADIVNLQLIHAAPFFSLLDLPRLSRKKRVVLSVHDMFLMTGHCIYSMGCERWKTGCGSCPDLGLPFAIKRDTSARNWKAKQWVFNHSNVDIVIGSKWQEQCVNDSPFLNRFRRHMIPYGVDTRVFKPTDKAEARRKLGIPEAAHVIAFRSAPYHRNFKGTNFVEEALRIFTPRRPTVLIVFEGIGALASIRDKYQFHEFGWVIDGETLAGGLQATDLFLMPSTAEAFGLMAIESMACGATPIVFDGTALPDTIGGSDCGVIVPQGDAAAMAVAIGDCLDHPEKLARLRENGLRHAVQKHGFDDYARSYLNLYQELAKEKRR